MLPGMNSRQMRQAMKKMGVAQEQIDAQEVIIRLEDRDIVITNPDVSKVNMMGQETYQVAGEAVIQERDSTPDVTEEDIATVMEQTGVDEAKAKQAIIDAQGDLAEAILSFQDAEE